MPQILANSFWPQDVFQMCMNQLTERLLGVILIHDNICVFGKSLRSILITSSASCKQQRKMAFSWKAKCAASDNLRSPFTVPCSPKMAWSPILQKYKYCKTFLLLIIKHNNYLQPIIPSLSYKTAFFMSQSLIGTGHPLHNQLFNTLNLGCAPNSSRPPWHTMIGWNPSSYKPMPESTG